MNYKKKNVKRLWGLVGLTVFSFFSVTILFAKTTPLLAKVENSVEKSEFDKRDQHSVSPLKKSLQTETQANDLGRVLDPIENESGLKITPKVLKIAQYDYLPDLYTEEGRKLLFSKQVIPKPEFGVEYEYVDAKGLPANPDSEQVGFQMIYVKVTENYSQTSVLVPIPVTVTDIGTSFLLTNQVALQIDHAEGKVLLYPEETKNKTEEQLQQLVKEKSKVRAWNTETGVEVSTEVIKTTISTTSVGTYKADFEITMGHGAEEQKASIQKNVVVFGANFQPFTTVQNTEFDLFNNLLQSGNKFQTVNGQQFDNADYEIVDETGNLTEVDTTTVGFKWIYVKMSEITMENVSTIIKVPLNVMNEDTTALLKNKVIVNAKATTVFYPNETKGKSKDELLEAVQSKVHLSAWNMNTGEMIPASFTKTTMPNNSVGTYTGTITVELNGEVGTTNRNFLVFGADLKSPHYVKVKIDEEFDMGEDANNVFSKYQSLTSSSSDTAYYEWVKDEEGKPASNVLDTSQAGFQWAYIKMTDKVNPEISTVIPIPVNVIADEEIFIVQSKAGLSFETNRPFMANEFKNKTVEEINQILTKGLSPKAWELTSGERLDVQITQTTINDLSTGSVEVIANITLNNVQLIYKFNIYILTIPIFEDSDLDGWISLPLNSTNGVIVNPLNESKMGFMKRGINPVKEPNETSEYGFMILDKNNTGYVFSYSGSGTGRVSNIPGVNNTVLYGDEWDTRFGLGADEFLPEMTKSYYLRKGNKLKQILIDKKKSIVYVYDLSLNKNLNFSIRLNMYNLSNTKKKFAMIESVDTEYYSDNVPIYALENNSGFYMEPQEGSRLSIKLKDFNGSWLSDYTKYSVLPQWDTFSSSFGNDFKLDTTESMNYDKDAVILKDKDTAYQLGAPWKDIAPNEALETGYEIFVGDEIPYMQMKANPEVFTVYEDHNMDVDTKYKLSEIPAVGDHGTVYAVYPNGKEVTTPFTANGKKEFDGKLTIPRAELPKQLNEEPGTIKSYDTGLLAINETKGNYNGLPSQDYSVKIKVYNLGAKPVPQIIQKGDSFNKKASELVRDAVILPGHKPSYKYEGEMPDTSVTGITSVTVRMTDTNQPEKTTLIKVPIQVIDGTPPTNGLYLLANDFSSSGGIFQDLNENERDDLILKKSEAIAWDTETASTDKIKLSVESTTLPSNPAPGSYKATIKATRDTETIKKTITIDIKNLNQKVNVEFVDEAGESLHDKITFDKTVGATIDLTKEKEVQKALETIQAKNYQLVKKPDNETQIPVLSEESTVQYQFKGMLYIQSSPDFLNFGRKSLGIPFIKVEKAKYDKPLIIWDNRKNGSAWNLTATLKKPLTSQEDSSKILPSAIRYKVSDTETVILSENTTQSIAKRTHESKGQYNVSNEWDKNETGLLLEVPSGKVLQTGSYRATILWQVEQTP